MKLGKVTDRVRDVFERRDRAEPHADDETPVGDDDANLGDDDANLGDDDANLGDDDANLGDDDVVGGVRDRLPAVTRRRLIGGVLGIGGAKAADNVLVGYGILTGTNLVDQNLFPIATDHLGPSDFSTTMAGSALSVEQGVLTVDDAHYPVWDMPREAGRDADREHGLAAGDERGPIEELAADWGAFRADPAAVDLRPSRTDAFFDTIEAGDVHPYTVHALRGEHFEPASPRTIRDVTDADPGAPSEIIPGLMHAFRETTNYDVPRYVAGSVEDNVLLGHGDLRQHFESPITFDALESGANTGMFCYEFVFRSIDALHAVDAHEQRHPVVAGIVTDSRHKHVYTALASVIEEDGELVVPLTFVDYTHSTLYDDLHADAVLGEGLEAYNTRHRATAMYWHDYVGGF